MKGKAGRSGWGMMRILSSFTMHPSTGRTNYTESLYTPFYESNQEQQEQEQEQEQEE